MNQGFQHLLPPPFAIRVVRLHELSSPEHKPEKPKQTEIPQRRDDRILEEEENPTPPISVWAVSKETGDGTLQG